MYGCPAPQGSKAFKGMVNGHGVMVESSKKVKPWRQDVKAAALLARNGAAALDGALRCRMIFTLPKPTSSPKRRRVYPMRKPDLSKLVRSTEDALVDAGFIADDARIVDLHAMKVFPNEHEGALEAPGVVIEFLEQV